MASRSKWVFVCLFIVGVAGVALSMLHKACLKPSDGATLFAGLLAGAIVWWQGYLIKQQMQLQAILDLVKEWDSPEMRERRKTAWNVLNEVDKDRIEGVLEFLERVSTLAKDGIISVDLVWDTLGWYLSRYAFYSRSSIGYLRSYWTPDQRDPTLYSDLQELERKLTQRERRRRRLKGRPALTKGAIEAEMIRKDSGFQARNRQHMLPRLRLAPWGT
jgi:hypothetical protein